MSLWTEPKYPGDAVRKVMLHRYGEIGDIRIQFVSRGLVKVCSFLPGETTCMPGDTPKTWPEKSEWCTSSFAADEVFDKYLGEAYEALWQNYYPEQHANG